MSGSFKRTRHRTAGSRRVTTVALAGLAGVLLWAKLRLVSDMPRSLYADPKAAHGPGQDRSRDGAGGKPSVHGPAPRSGGATQERTAGASDAAGR